MTPAFLACCFFLQTPTPEAIEHAQTGAAAAQQGRLDEAIREFRKVTELQPNSAVAFAHLGDAYFQNGEYIAAIPELEHALRLNPGLNDTHETLGVVLLMEGNAEAALPHLEKMPTPELIGLAYLETGRLGAAITELEAALKKHPNDTNLLYYFGRAAALASKQSLDQLAAIDPELARKSVAAPENASQPDLVSLVNALSKKPNDPNLLFAVNRAAEQASKAAFDRIFASAPDCARAHQLSAERAFAEGRLAEAEGEYAESLRLKPYTSGVHLAFGNVLAAQGNWPAAMAQFGAEMKLRPFNADAFYSLGSLLLAQGQARAAVEQLAEAGRLKPESPQILLELGRAALAANDPARAEAAWTKLLAIDSKSALAASARQALSKLKNPGAAH